MSLLQKILIGVGFFIASIAVFLLGVFLFTVFLTSGLNDPIEKQLTAIQHEDYVIAYSFTSHSFQDATSLETFKSTISLYPALRNNETIHFDSKSIENSVGTVTATLISRGGVEVPVIYKLIKEKGKWKIENIIIDPNHQNKTSANNPPVSADTSTQHSSTETPVSAINTATKTTPAKPDTPEVEQAPVLSNQYVNPYKGYSIDYPANWTYNQVDPYTVTLQKSDGQAPAVSIHSLAIPGHYRSVNQFSRDLFKSMQKQSVNARLADQGVVTMPATNTTIKAKFFVYTYTKQDTLYQTLAVIFYSKEKHALYALLYTKPAATFNAELMAVKGMTESMTYLK